MCLLDGLELNLLGFILVVDVIELLLKRLLARVEMVSHFFHLLGHLVEHLALLSLPVSLDCADPDELVAHLEDQGANLPAIVLNFLQAALELAYLCTVLTLLLGLGGDEVLDTVELGLELHSHTLLIDLDEPPRHRKLLLETADLTLHTLELDDVLLLPTLFEAQFTLQTSDIFRTSLLAVVLLLLCDEPGLPQLQALINSVLQHRFDLFEAALRL